MLASFLSGSFYWGVSLTHPMLALFFCDGINFISALSLRDLMLASFLSGELLLHIVRWLHLYAWSFSYTSQADFLFIRGVSLTHPVLS